MMIKKTVAIMAAAFGFFSTVHSAYAGKMAAGAFASALASGSAMYYCNQSQAKEEMAKRLLVEDNQRKLLAAERQRVERQNFLRECEQRRFKDELARKQAELVRNRIELDRQLRFKNDLARDAAELRRKNDELRYQQEELARKRRAAELTAARPRPKISDILR